MEKKYCIVYHSEDADGLVSAALVYNWLNGMRAGANEIPSNIGIDNDNIKLLGTTYAELAGLVRTAAGYDALLADWKRKYTDIIMLDMSFNDTDMMRMLYKEYNNNILWFDHHAPAIKASEKLGYANMRGSRHTCTSTIMLVWHWLYGHLENANIRNSMQYAPAILRALAGYDSWKPEAHGFDTIEYCNEVTRGFEYATELDIACVVPIVRDIAEYWLLDYNNSRGNRYDGYERNDMDMRIARLGERIRDFYKKCQNDGEIVSVCMRNTWQRAIEEFGDFTWEVNGKRACALFMQAPANTIYFNGIKEKYDTGSVIIFKKCANSGNWSVSLYNIDDSMHVGEYLKHKYNGGGHSGAGGATLSSEQFDAIMKSHKL